MEKSRENSRDKEMFMKGEPASFCDKLQFTMKHDCALI